MSSDSIEYAYENDANPTIAYLNSSKNFKYNSLNLLLTLTKSNKHKNH